MLHERRWWGIAPAASPEDLAHKLTEFVWETNTGFKLGGYLFLNDSTGPNGAQEYAVVKNPREKDGPYHQIESITFSWCNYGKALSHIKKAVAGEYDNSPWATWKESFRGQVKLESPFESLQKYFEHLKNPFCLRTNHALPLPETPEQWADIVARISEPGRIAEVTEDTYDHFLDALPPKWMAGSSFCFAEGEVSPCLFWKDRERYFARKLGDDEWKTFIEIAMRPRQKQGRDRDHEPEITR
jgi:hypothetical protein